MQKKTFDTPILFLVFNRPDTTSRVFDQLRLLKPEKLFVAADGPRENNKSDAEKCEAVKDIILQVDWDCEVQTLYRTTNLGCKKAVSEGISWFFDLVEEGIIVEDDILPDLSFFYFCAAMLEYYRNDHQIMHIAGFNVLGNWKSDKQSYHKSYFGSIWGWATWRRAWKFYDVSITAWQNEMVQKNILQRYFPPQFRIERKKLYDAVAENKIDTWDYQWTFSRLLHDGQSVISSVNLVDNIGFNEQATHTHSAPAWTQNGKSKARVPIIHPAKNMDKAYDLSHLKLTCAITHVPASGVRKYLKKIIRYIVD